MSKTIIKRGSVRKADPVDDGTHEVETDEADNPVTTEAQKDVEPLKHSAQVICALMRHKGDEDDYLKGELGAMDHPEMKAGIEDYQAHREEGMKKLKALMEEHHPDVDVDKALAGEEPGEEGLEGEEGFTQDEKDEPEEDEDDDEDVDDLVEEYSRPKGKGLKRKSVKKALETDNPDPNVIKDASDFMCDLADDDQINKVHKAALKYHSAALKDFHDGYYGKSIEDMGDTSDGEHDKSAQQRSVEDMGDSSDGEHDKRKASKGKVSTYKTMHVINTHPGPEEDCNIGKESDGSYFVLDEHGELAARCDTPRECQEYLDRYAEKSKTSKKKLSKDNSYPQKPSQSATDGRVAASDDEDLEEDVKSLEDMGDDSVDGEHDKGIEAMGDPSSDGEHDKDMEDDGEEMEVDDDAVETKAEDDEEEEKSKKKVAPKSLEVKVDRFLRTLYRATGVRN